MSLVTQCLAKSFETRIAAISKKRAILLGNNFFRTFNLMTKDCDSKALRLLFLYFLSLLANYSELKLGFHFENQLIEI